MYSRVFSCHSYDSNIFSEYFKSFYVSNVSDVSTIWRTCHSSCRLWASKAAAEAFHRSTVSTFTPHRELSEVFILNLGQVGQGHDILWVNKNNGNKSKSTYIDFEDVNSHKDPTDANHSTKAPNVAMKEGQALLSQACANEAVKHTKNKNSLKTFMFKPKGTH